MVKILCTIGPSCDDEATLAAMADVGMDMVRFNLAHTSEQYIEASLPSIKKLGLPVVADLEGAKLRVGPIAGARCALKEGATLYLADGIGLGNSEILGFNLPGIIPQLEPGTKLRIYECGISLEVVEVDGAGGRCRCVVERGGVCEQGKGISVRSGINLPALSERDLRFHIPWTKKYAFDYLALSFASGAEPLLKLKELLEDSSTRIIAKVETRDAIDHLEEILDNSVMVMIDRGDLGTDIPIEEVPFVQKLVLGKCRERNTEAIVATHLLDSMTEQPRPMVSEVGDVIQSILDGGSVMMLSRETAVGKNPVQCVQTLTNIITRTEAFAEQLASRQLDSGYDEVLKEYLRQLNYLI